MALSPEKLYSRVTEGDLIAWRGFRIQTGQEWKARLRQVDQMYRGDWQEMFSDQSMVIENPMVMNMVQVGMNDIAKLVSESEGSVRCLPDKDTKQAEENALIRQNIGHTYWNMNRGEDLIPRIAMDLAGGGMAAIGVWVDPNDSDDDDTPGKQYGDFPCYSRIDPRFAYPDVRNGILQDMLVVEEMNLRVAAREFPMLHLDSDPTIISNKVEIMTYYSKKECLQAVLWRNTQAKGNVIVNVEIVSRWDPQGVLPVAFVQYDSWDGAMRGIFDQMGGSLFTKNRIVRQVMDYMDEVVYAPRMSKGVLNPDEPFSPDTHYRLDPNVPQSMIGRVPPASTIPQVLDMLEFLDKEQRGSAAFPASRQGEVSQAIASASFVASTQGQLTSEVKNIQRLIASLRQQLNSISYRYDEKFLDWEKPLSRPIGRKTTYLPSRDIAGNYRNDVTYGAGSGLDQQSADVRTLQLLGSHVISLDTAREQINFITDPDGEGDKVDIEQTMNAVMQKFMSDADLPSLLKVLDYQANQGDDLSTALTRLAADQQAQQAAPGAAGAPGAPGAPQGGPQGAPPAPPGPMQAQTDQQAMAAGGTTPPQPTPGQFAPPPAEAVQVAPVQANRTVQLR
jgi:hypothetical protein